MNPTVLIVLCRPWLVALPLASVVRIVPAEEVRESQGAVVGADGTAWKLHRLAAMLGVPGGDEPARVLLLGPDGPACLATGRCLHVRPLPAPAIELPQASRRSGLPLSCFAAGALAGEPGLASYGLLLDPIVWLAGRQQRAVA